jgi:hypothetical protein
MKCTSNVDNIYMKILLSYALPVIAMKTVRFSVADKRVGYGVWSIINFCKPNNLGVRRMAQIEGGGGGGDGGGGGARECVKYEINTYIHPSYIG